MIQRPGVTIAGAAVAIVGAGVLTGWATGSDRLVSVVADLPPMRPLSAVSLVLLGLGIALLGADRDRAAAPAAALGGAALALAATSLVAAWLGRAGPLDTLLFAGDVEAAGGAHPGRMPPATAAGVALLGAALVGVGLGRTWVAHGAALAASVVAGVGVAGYLYGATSLRSFGADGSISVHAAACLVVAGSAMLRALPEHGLTAVARQGPGAALLVHLGIPVVVVVPVLVGWLQRRGEQSGWWDDAMGEAMAAVAAATIGGGVLWRSGVLVARYERGRAAARHELERVNAALEDEVASRTETLREIEAVQRESLDALEEGVAVISADLELRFINRSGRRLLGYEPEEITALWQSGRWETYREDGTPLPRDERPVARSLATGEPTTGVVVRWRAKDGSMIPLRVSTRPLFEGGAVTGLVIAFADVTARGAAAEPGPGDAPSRGRLPAIEPRQRILLVAPRAAATEELRRHLAFAGHDVVVAHTAEEAAVGARKRRPALVVAEVGREALDGDELLARIKGDPLVAHVPVLLLTEPVSGGDAARALAGGAFDVVRTPIEPVELVARVDAALRSSTRTSDLVHLSRSLDRVSRTDALTGLLNRRGIDDQVDRMEGFAQRRGDVASALALDLDRFKSINDRFGHLAGDRALRAVADVVNQELRTDDVAGRWGGEEFVVLLPDSDLDGAVAAAERMRAGVEALEVEADEGTRFRLTISIGVAQVVDGDLRAAIAAADRRLLAAKAAGRNRVLASDDAVA